MTNNPEFSFYEAGEEPTQNIIFGNGTSNRVGKIAKKFGQHALLVTDSGLSSVGHPQKIQKILEAANLKVTLFDESIENPTESSVQACVQVAEKSEVDLIIGLGGGSSMDTAKGCNFILSNGGKMSDFWGVDKVTRPMYPLIAIPTTAGTGSECQSFALISNDISHKKMACGDKKALPRVTLLDPKLTLSQPNSVTACTGVDALSHALESMVTSKRNKKSHHHAQLAFQLIQEFLPLVLKDPTDLNSRGQVLLGASHAGAAIERSMLGAAHSMANPLTANRGIIHGVAVGIVLPEVMKFNKIDLGTNSIYAELARDSGIASMDCHDEEASGLLIEKIYSILKLAKIPSFLNELGFAPLDIPSLALDASEQWTANFNPRPVSRDDFENIYSNLFSTTPCETQSLQTN
jgi:alcohol dehydrogenase